MANRPYRSRTGAVMDIASCAAAHTVGDLVIENGFVGQCQQTNLINAANQLVIDGVIRNVKFPASCAQGTYLYAAGAPPTNGNLLASATATNLTKTAASNTLVGQVADMTTSTVGSLLLFSQAAGKI